MSLPTTIRLRRTDDNEPPIATKRTIRCHPRSRAVTKIIIDGQAA